MNLLKKIWDNFKTQPDHWFFYGFLLTFTLSIRKELFFYPIAGQFNEYTGIYLYLSDIFLLLTILSWLISILCNKQYHLSILKNVTAPRVPRELFHVEQFFRGGILIIPLALVIWSFISINWANNQNIAFFRSIKLLEYYSLFLYIIIQIVPRGTILCNTFKLIVSISLIQAVIGIWQFLIQHSIGFFWLKESLISPNIDGVAKVIFDGDRIIRAYGLFPHPNIMGGFLLLSIILTIAHHKMFHVEQSLVSLDNKSDIKCSTWNNEHCDIYTKKQNVPRGTIYSIISKIKHTSIYYTILGIQIIAIILTFSKSAILGLFIAISYIYWGNIKKYAIKMFHVEQSNKNDSRIKCSTWNNYHCKIYNKKVKPNAKLFHVEHFGRKLIILAGIVIALIVITKPNMNSLFFKSLKERLVYINVSRGTISNKPIIGIGSGQFVLNMQKNVPRGTILEPWQYQPVHNVFLLIWSELGLIGLSLFLWILWKLFHVEQFKEKSVNSAMSIKCSTWNNYHCELYKSVKIVPRGTILGNSNVCSIFRGLFIGFIFIMLFDHYLWDIQQGQVILWMALAFLSSI